MAGFKEGALQLKKRNTTLPSDPGTIKVYIDTNNKLYTVDEFGTSAYVDTNTSGTSGTSGVGYTLITSGNNLIISTSGLNQIIDLKPTGVTSGTFGSNITVPVITLDPFGRILSASTVPISASGFGTVTSVSVSSTTLSGGGTVTTMGTINVGLSAITTSGVHTKIVNDIYGRVISATDITSADIPQLPPTKITTNSTNRFVTDGQITNWNSAYTSSHNHSNKSTLDLINQSLNTSANISANSFIGVATKALSAEKSDILKTARSISINGELTSTSALFDGSQNIVISASLMSGINATKIADGSISNTEFQYLNGTSANIQTQLSNLSAIDSTKANSSVTITTTSGLTGGGDLTTNRTIGLVAVGTSGIYSNFVTNAYGQVTSARALISADIPTLPPSKILEDSNDRFVSDTQINSWTGTTTTVQPNSANWNLAYTSAHNHPNKSNLDLINQSVNTSANVIFNTLSATNLSGATLTIGNISNTEFNYLDNLSANIQTQLSNLSATKANSSVTITAGTMLSGGGDLTSNRTISHQTVGTSGTYSNFVTNSTGHITSARALISADIPTLPATKIGTGNISNTEFEYLNGVSANIQDQFNNITNFSIGSLSAYFPVSGGTIFGRTNHEDDIVLRPIIDRNPGDIGLSANAIRIYPDTGVDSLSFNYEIDSSAIFQKHRFYISGSTLVMELGDTISFQKPVQAVSIESFNYKFFTANGGRVIVTDNLGNLVESNITSAVLNYLTGTSANIQNQLSALSAIDSTKANSSIVISGTSGLIGGGDLSTNRNIGLPNIGVVGTYTKVSTDQYGRISAATNITSADIPTLPTNKISQDISNRFVSDTQINSWTSTSATVASNSANWNSSFTSAHNHTNKSTLDLINQSLNTSATVLFDKIELGKVDSIGSTGNTDWLHIANFQKTEFGASRKYFVTLHGGDWSDNSKIDYLFDTYGTNSSLSAFSIERIFSTWRSSSNEIYNNIEFKTFRNSATDDYDIYVRGTNVDFFTLGADVKYSTASGLYQSYIITSANTSLPTSATHVELITTVHEQPIRMLNDILYIRNINLARSNDYDYSDTSAVSDIRFNGTSLYPNTGYDLGTTSKRWKNIFGLSANIGNISATTITVGSIDNTEFNYLNNVSANIQTQLNNLSATKANSSVTINTTSGLTGGGDLSTNRTIGLVAVGISGIYSNIITNAYGQVTSARNLLSADIPTLPATKIGTGIINDTEFSYLDGVSANIQTQLNQLSQQSVSGNGAGTPNTLTKFITSSSMGNSTITDNGSLVTFTTSVSSNNTITAPNFTGLASRATSALNADTLKTGRNFSISGDIYSSNIVSFDGSSNVVLTTVLSGIPATKVADGSVSNTEFQYLNSLSANAQNQLSALSALNSTKANASVTITTTSGLTGGGDLSTNRTIGLLAVGTSGIYSNFVTNAYGQVTSARALISADIPTLPATKIGTGIISDTEFNYLDTVSANIQTQLSNLSANNVLSNAVVTNNTTTQVISGDGALILQRPDLSANTYATRQAPGTFANFIIQVDGKHKWGTSGSNSDTYLERAGTNHLRTSGTFTARHTIRSTGFDSAASIVEGGPGVEINYISATDIGRIISYDRTATSAKSFVIGSKDTTVLAGPFMTVSAAKFTDTVNTFYLPISGTSVSANSFTDNSFSGSRALVSGPNKDIIESSLISSIELDQLEGISANVQTQLSNLSGTKANSYTIGPTQVAVGGTNVISGSDKLLFDNTTLTIGQAGNITNPKLVLTHNSGVSGGPEIIIGSPAGGANDENSGKLKFRPGNAGFRHIDTTEPKYKFQRWNSTNAAFETVYALESTVTSNKDVTFYGSVIAPTLSATSITVGSIDNTEFQYLNGTSANVQVQLTNLSGTKADKTITITAGTMLSGGGDLSTNRTISHQTVGTAGTYSNIVTNSTGHITSARALIAGDLPSGIDATKIADGSVTSTEFQYINTLSANAQTQLINISANNNFRNAVVTNPTGPQTIVIDNGKFLILSAFNKTDGAIVTRTSAYTGASSDFVIFADGKTEWGSGSAARDTNLYRGNADLLKTDDTISVVNNIRVTNYNNAAANTEGGAALEIHYLSATETGRVLSYDRTAAIRKKIEINGSEIRNVVGVTGGGELLTSNTTSALHSIYIPVSAGNISATNFYDTSFVGSRALVSDSDKEIIESSVTNTELSYLLNVSANIQTQLNQLAQATVSGNGAGTPNRITKFITSSSMGDSSITDTGSLVTFTTQVSANNTITAPNFTGLASRATSALNADTLKTARSFSLSGEVTSINVPTFNGSGNIVLSAVIANGIDATKIADGSVTNTEFQYINTLSTNAQTQLTNLSAIKANLASTVMATTYDTGNIDVPEADTIYSFMGSKNITSGTTPFGNMFYNILDVRHRNGGADGLSGYGGQLVWGMTNSKNRMAFRTRNAGGSGWETWNEIWSNSNLPVSASHLSGTSANVQTQLINLSATNNIVNAVIKNPTSEQIITNQLLRLRTSATSSPGYVIEVSGDTAARQVIYSDGKIEWGPGNATRDVNLYRESADILRTDDTFKAAALSATTLTIGNISNTEFNYLDTVSANIQTQLSNLSATSHTHSNKSTLDLINQSLNSSATVIFNTLTVSGNGKQNLFIGDDGSFGDINTANTICLSGRQNNNQAYVKFANDSNSFGYNGTTLVYGNNKVWTSADFTQTNIDSWKNSRAGQGIYTNEDSLPLSARNLRGVNFGRTFQAIDSPDQTNYYSFIQMPEVPGNNNQSIIAAATTTDDVYFGRGAWNTIPSWNKIWTSINFSQTNITNWNTAYTSAHNHSNKATLDLINQSLNTSATISADKFHSTNNGNGTNFRVGDDVWLGDINQNNTMSIKGVQSSTYGYIRFGTDTNSFGYDGSRLTYTGTLSSARLELLSQPESTIYTSSVPEYYIGQTFSFNDGWKIYGEGNTNEGKLVFEVNDDYNEEFLWTQRNTSNVRRNLMKLYWHSGSNKPTLHLPGTSGLAFFDTSTSNLAGYLNATSTKQFAYTNNNSVQFGSINYDDILGLSTNFLPLSGGIMSGIVRYTGTANHVSATRLDFGDGYGTSKFMIKAGGISFYNRDVVSDGFTYTDVGTRMVVAHPDFTTGYDGQLGVELYGRSYSSTYNNNIQNDTLYIGYLGNNIKTLNTSGGISFENGVFKLFKPNINTLLLTNDTSLITTTATIPDNISMVSVSALSDISRINMPANPTEGQILIINCIEQGVDGHKLYGYNNTNLILYTDTNGTIRTVGNSGSPTANNPILLTYGSYMFSYANGYWLAGRICKTV